MKKTTLLAGALLAAFSMTTIANTAMPSYAQEAKAIQPFQGTAILVNGTGEVTIKPDIARITVGVQTRNTDSTVAGQENANKINAIIKAIKALGVAEKDIQTTDYSISPQFNYVENKPPVLVDYQVSNSVRITVRKIADSGKVLDAAMKAGANIANGIQFDLSDPQQARDEALAKAVADATRKANLMAKASGNTKPLILSELTENAINDGPRPVYAMRSLGKLGGEDASTAVEAGETKITATVSAKFLVWP